MPSTYTPLATTTLGSSQASVTLSGISGSYTDLVLVISAQGTSAGLDQDINMTFNSDTGSNYSRVRLYGNGTSAVSTRDTNASSITIGNMPAASSVLGSGNSIIQIQNYSNSTTYKTSIIRTNTSSTYGTVFAIFGMWRSNSAITSITLTPAGGSFTTGSTFSLYGIASAAVVSGAKATGGDVVATDGTYWYHAFLASGTFTPTQALTADVLVVAGGGGAMDNSSGGGGAGGLLAHTSQSLSVNNYTVTVGAGGSGGTDATSTQSNAGNNSQFAALTASVGGGRGLGRNVSQPTQTKSGGSGGGGTGTGTTANTGNTGGSATAGQGNAGGNGFAFGETPAFYPAAGGGGAGAAGSAPSSSSQAGAGGVGSSTYSSWGLATSTGQNVGGTVYFAGGGGGGINSAGQSGSGAGGSGGGGSNGNGTANTGGGGGAKGYPATGGAGGSGIVIVRYAV
jgi:hypothetical protein